MNKTLLIIGGSSTGLEIRETVDRFLADSFNEVFNVIGDSEKDCKYSFVRDSQLDGFKQKNLHYIISFADFDLRRKFIQKMEELGAIPETILHPSVEVFPSATIGKNVYIAAQSIISSYARIEDHVIINFQSIIGHDSIIGGNTIINPSVKVGGFVKVGESTLIGAGSFIKQNVEIGEESLIDAMTYVDKSIPPRSLCTSKMLKVYKRVI